MKFFIFTQVSGLLMLSSIVILAWQGVAAGGELSFSYFDLLGLHLDGRLAWITMLGFFLAFTVKLPAFPFHTWLPDAHTQAPTAGSVLLAGILLKTGAYGLLRFCIPLFPEISMQFAPVAMGLGSGGESSTAPYWLLPRATSSVWWLTAVSAIWALCCWGCMPGITWRCKAPSCKWWHTA